MGAVEDACAARAASLERHFAALERWLELGEPAWSARPAADAWSPREIVEHVALMQRYVLLLAQKIAARGLKRAARGVPLPSESSDVRALEHLAGRGFRWTHPEHMAPTGERDRGDLRREIGEQRALCRALLERAPHGEGALHAARMSVVGVRLDLYQFLALVDLHLQRHLAQLERALGGPL